VPVDCCHKRWTSWPERGYLDIDPALEFELPIALNAAHLCALVSTGLIHQLPRISRKQIQDKSKEDAVVKLLTLLQVLLLFIQLVERKVSGLPSAQLEIAVLSFAICTFITYLLWMGKPKDVNVATEVWATRELTECDKFQLIELNLYGFFENAVLSVSKHKPAPRIQNDAYLIESTLFENKIGWGMNFAEVGFILGSVVFGACHCIAWTFDFPTLIERALWRAASVFTTAAMPAYYFGWYVLALIGPRHEGLLLTVLTSITYTLYTVCRFIFHRRLL
jgi:hypothetical protein